MVANSVQSLKAALKELFIALHDAGAPAPESWHYALVDPRESLTHSWRLQKATYGEDSLMDHHLCLGTDGALYEVSDLEAYLDAKRVEIDKLDERKAKKYLPIVQEYRLSMQ